MHLTDRLVRGLVALAALAWIAGCGGGASSTDEDSDTGTNPDVVSDAGDVPLDVPVDEPTDVVEDAPADSVEDAVADGLEDTMEDVATDLPEDVPEDLPIEEVAPYCGDGSTDPGEDCDDGNDVPDDGCEDDCTFSCEVDGDCLDAEDCNGEESCDPTTHACVSGPPMVDGTLCEADGLSTTRDICVSGVCALSDCGDGFPDPDGGEECDDGNSIPDDGCENDCSYSAITVTGYRMITLDIVDPHLYTQVAVCMDITDTANTEFQNGIDTYDLNMVNLFRPLDMDLTTNYDEFITTAICAAGSPDACTRDASTTPVATTANNVMDGSTTCLSADPAVLNSSYSAPNAPNGPCFYTDAETFVINLGGLSITLQHAQVAAMYYTGTPPDTLVNGVIIGFLSTADAEGAVMPADLPLIGGDTLYEHLADGRAAGSACETAFGGWNVDDSDEYGTQEGFWFHLNFTAELITWTDP